VFGEGNVEEKWVRVSKSDGVGRVTVLCRWGEMGGS